MIPKVWELLDQLPYIHYRNEVSFDVQGFTGIADILADNGDGTFDILDFKYSNNQAN